MLSNEDFIRIILAVIAGGMIGLEREFRDKAAGFRTLIFICTGATLFTMLSGHLAQDRDPTRIAAQIVSGVGFLGAGVILREGGRVIGLTTAATIWLTAALGMAIGGGQYALAGAGLAMALIVLWLFPWIEHLIDNIWEVRAYELVCSLNIPKIAELEGTFRANGLLLKERHQVKSGNQMTCRWLASGRPKAHERLTAKLLADPDVHELRF